jgi:hypothetical protein
LPPPGGHREISRRHGPKKRSPGISRYLPAAGKISRRNRFFFGNLPADPVFYSYLPAAATLTSKIRNFDFIKVGYFQPKRRDFGRIFGSPGGEVHLRVKSPGFANFSVATLHTVKNTGGMM